MLLSLSAAATGGMAFGGLINYQSFLFHLSNKSSSVPRGFAIAILPYIFLSNLGWSEVFVEELKTCTSDTFTPVGVIKQIHEHHVDYVFTFPFDTGYLATRDFDILTIADSQSSSWIANVVVK